ncbi:class I SAM-dependent methyltransferase [Haloarcula litorea]|uniref:class I SAM-dependent methyltransferase n=1 Tax=Haloarcula litorea TaxID=3032579 RepID=UPI003AF32D32
MPPARTGKLRAGLALARRPVDRLVDLGGGPGRASRRLGVPETIVLDAAPGMLARARKHELAAVAGDAARLPLATDSVDAVLVVDALHHIRDLDGILREVERVLRPGGVLVVRDFDPGTVRGRALAAGEHLVGFDSRFLGPWALVRAVNEAGLDGRVVESGFGYTVAGVAGSGTGK